MEREYPYLYRNTHGEADRQGELELWMASFKENVCCARAIEKAIRDGGEEHIPPDCAKDVIEDYGLKRTMYVLANSVRNLGRTVHPSEDTKMWGESVDILPDPEYDRYFEADTALSRLEEFVGQVRAQYQALGLIDKSRYTPLSGVDLEGKVLVLSPDTLREEYWTPKAQLWYAHGGFGCSPTARGRAIVATCLGDGERVFWNRQDFDGVLDEKYLPDWAREKLQELRTPAPEPAQGTGGMEMK